MEEERQLLRLDLVTNLFAAPSLASQPAAGTEEMAGGEGR